MWRRILDAVAAGDVAADAFASLRFADTGTSATPPELLAAIRALVPQATVRVFYGSTEAGQRRQPRDGRLRAQARARRRPEPAHRGPASTADGELEVTGPLLFDGYFEDADATAAALVDGWYRTGDLAELDDDGFVTITGRAHATIRTGGETVAPTEVELVLARRTRAVSRPRGRRSPDADYGEVVCAAVVCAAIRHGGARLEELRDVRVEREPRRVQAAAPARARDEIPRTPATGQVQRHLLVERMRFARSDRRP